MAEGLKVGFRDLIFAAIPDTCGQDMEVPDKRLKAGFSLAGAAAVYLPVHAARMFTPGAVTSG